MKLKLFGLFLLLLLCVGCSSERQFLDAGWTQKPAKMKILVTNPTVSDEETLPDVMDPISDWFREKVDHAMQFNSNVPCVVEKISKKKISHEPLNMSGVEVQIPKVEAMSDSFDIYMILDNVQMVFSESSRTVGGSPVGAVMVVPAGGAAMASVASAGITIKGESTEIDADYVVYDVKSGKRLAYGHLEESVFHEEIAMEQGWYENVRQLMLKILGKTPVTRF